MNAQQKYCNRSATFKKEDKIGRQNKSFHSLSNLFYGAKSLSSVLHIFSSHQKNCVGIQVKYDIELMRLC